MLVATTTTQSSRLLGSYRDRWVLKSCLPVLFRLPYFYSLQVTLVQVTDTDDCGLCVGTEGFQIKVFWDNIASSSQHRRTFTPPLVFSPMHFLACRISAFDHVVWSWILMRPYTVCVYKQFFGKCLNIKDTRQKSKPILSTFCSVSPNSEY